MRAGKQQCFGTTAIPLRKRSTLTWTMINLFPREAPLLSEKENDGTSKTWRRGWDSNPRMEVLQTSPLGHLGTAPNALV